MYTDIITHLQYIPKAIVFTVFLIISFLFVKENNGMVIQKVRVFIKENKIIVLFLFYSALLFTGTVIGRPYTNPFVNMIGDILLINHTEINYGCLVNILIFIPYIYLYLRAFSPPKPARNSIYFSIATTVIIELLQTLFWLGEFSISDMLQNITGGMIGFGIWNLLYHIRNKFKEHKNV